MPETPLHQPYFLFDRAKSALHKTLMRCGLVFSIVAAGISYGCSSRAAPSEAPAQPEIHNTIQNDGSSPDNSFPDLGADVTYRTDQSNPKAKPDYGTPVQPDLGVEPDSGRQTDFGYQHPDLGGNLFPDLGLDSGQLIQPDLGAGQDLGLENCVDTDNDGFYSVINCGTEIDCNDTDASLWRTIFAYVDNDIDGFGSPGIAEVCAGMDLPSGYTLNNLDCNDSEDTINPVADDLCDGIDNNCNGQIDEDHPGGLIGYWNFDEDSGVNVYDASGNDLDGTLSDAAARGTGIYNLGLSLDGRNDVVRVPRDDLLDLEELTITHWIRRSTERQARIACRHDDGGSDTGYATEISADGRFIVIIGGYAYASNDSVPLNEWTHLATTLNGEGQLKLYINGELDAVRTLNTPIRPDSSLDLVMGRQANSLSANHFQGGLDEVKIYSCALGEGQIRDDYEGN